MGVGAALRSLLLGNQGVGDTSIRKQYACTVKMCQVGYARSTAGGWPERVRVASWWLGMTGRPQQWLTVSV